MKQEFQIKGELITLDALLKAVGAADSGAHAKAMVAEGLVRVDGAAREASISPAARPKSSAAASAWSSRA